MTPEQKARVSIDALLTAAGWHVCDMAHANIHAARGVAIREFPLNPGYGFADYLLYIDAKKWQHADWGGSAIRPLCARSTLLTGYCDMNFGRITGAGNCSRLGFGSV